MIIKSATIFCLIALTYSATIRERGIPVEIRYDGEIDTGKLLTQGGDVAVSNNIVKSSDNEVSSELKTPQENSETPLEKAVHSLLGEKPQTQKEIVDEILPGKKLPDELKNQEEPLKVSDEPKNEEKQEQIQVEEKQEEQKQEEPKPQEQKLEEQKQEEQKEEKQKVEEQKQEEPKQEEQKPVEPPSEQIVPAKPNEKPEEQKKDDPALEELPQPVTNSVLEPIAMKDEPVEALMKDEDNNDEKPQLAPDEKTAPQEQNDKQPEKIEVQETKQTQPSPLSEQPNLLMRGNSIDDKSEVVEPVQVKALPDDQSKSLKGESILSEAQEIVSKGLKKLKESISTEGGGPKPEQWETLEKKVREYFQDEKRRLETKQENENQNQNVIQSVISNFQSMTNDFLQNIRGTRNNTQADEGQQGGPFQGVTSFIQNGFNTIQQSISNLGGGPSTSNTVLGDGATTAAPGIFQNFVSGIQNFVSNIGGGGAQTEQPGNQADTGTGQPGQSQGPAQQVIQQIGNTINSIIRPNQQQSVSDGSTQAPNIIQTIGQNINNAIQNINPFRPQESSTSAPAVEDEDAKKPLAAAEPSPQAPPQKVPQPENASQPEKLAKPETLPSQPEAQPSQINVEVSQQAAITSQSPLEAQPQPSKDAPQMSSEKKKESNEKLGMK